MTKKLLTYLNKEYAGLHTAYEELFWLFYMGDHKKEKAMNKALKARDAFRASREYAEKVEIALNSAKAKEKTKLEAWKLFFSKYQTPPELMPLKDKIAKLESKILRKRATIKQGYIDPKTKKFIKASENEMGMIIRTHSDEKIRKACFFQMEKDSKVCLDEYIEMVGLLNEYARKLGFTDFYDYKINVEEGMTKKELFDIFDDIFDKTKYVFKDIRKMEKKMTGLRKPWNFGYMLSGDFTKEEDPYFQFDQALERWGRSFAALSINYRGGSLKLDLLDRKHKWNNGFCHWPKLVQYENGKRIPGASNFTCTLVAGQVGSGSIGMETLFHEGGHAAHLLNSEQTEVCLNHEYPPASTAWDETQSMFLDSVFSSIEWKTRYAYDENGNQYPFSLFSRKLKKVHKVIPLRMMSIMFVANFEKEIYECDNLNADKALKIARKIFRKYFEHSEDSLLALRVPHIYSWESACAYHGYGLAELAVCQWRAYFYKKYEHIVDNPNIGKEMKKVWKLGASKTFKEFVILATGEKLSSNTYINNITMGLKKTLELAQKRIKRMEPVKRYKGKIKLNADIKMVSGKEEICSNKKGFSEMAQKYKEWLDKENK